MVKITVLLIFVENMIKVQCIMAACGWESWNVFSAEIIYWSDFCKVHIHLRSSCKCMLESVVTYIIVCHTAFKSVKDQGKV